MGDAELQYEKSRRRNQWKFLNHVKAENMYRRDGLINYHAWSELRAFRKYCEPLLSQQEESRVEEFVEVDEDLFVQADEDLAPLPSGSVKSSGLPTLPIEFAHRIIGKYADRVVDR